ncbi:MAG: hypothetical protein QOF61_20, partial [Acidobacteriota bacterium]|nr:hypothetical protein [Acidobacteriota bacterium]
MKTDYGEAWRKIRRGQRALIIVFATYAPAQLFIAPLLVKLLPLSVNGGSVIFVIWSIGIIFSGIYLVTRRCPRCRKDFFQKSWHHDPFAR